MSTSDPLPGLIDRGGLVSELGISHAMADAIFRLLPVIRLPGVRRAWVKREDVKRALDRWSNLEP